MNLDIDAIEESQLDIMNERGVTEEGGDQKLLPDPGLNALAALNSLKNAERDLIDHNARMKASKVKRASFPSGRQSMNDKSFLSQQRILTGISMIGIGRS